MEKCVLRLLINVLTSEEVKSVVLCKTRCVCRKDTGAQIDCLKEYMYKNICQDLREAELLDYKDEMIKSYNDSFATASSENSDSEKVIITIIY